MRGTRKCSRCEGGTYSPSFNRTQRHWCFLRCPRFTSCVSFFVVPVFRLCACLFVLWIDLDAVTASVFVFLGATRGNQCPQLFGGHTTVVFTLKFRCKRPTV